jgi:hypothetical protein
MEGKETSRDRKCITRGVWRSVKPRGKRGRGSGADMTLKEEAAASGDIRQARPTHPKHNVGECKLNVVVDSVRERQGVVEAVDGDAH